LLTATPLPIRPTGANQSLENLKLVPSPVNSTLLPSSAPCVNSVADSDPTSYHIFCASRPILENGRGTSKFDPENDALNNYLFARPSTLEYNALDIQRPDFSQAYDVQSTTSDGDDAPVTTAIPSGLASSKMDKDHELRTDIYALLPSSAPCVDSVADDDPIYSLILSSPIPILDNGRVTSEFDSRVLCDSVPILDNERGTSEFGSEGDNDAVTTAIPSGLASSKTNKAHNVEDDTRKPARNLIRGTYIGCTDGEQVLNEEGTERILQQPYEDEVAELYVKVAPEKRFDASQFRKALLEHDYDVFNPDALDAEHTPALLVNHLRVPASHIHPDVDFNEQNGSSDELALCINALSSRAVTDKEAVIGSFTQLKTLSTRHEWQAGEFKQLDRLHALPFAIELIAMEGQPVLLLRQVDDFALACSNEDTANCIYGTFGERLKLEHIPVAPFECFGLLPAYNGVDVD
jgi:hypothetical protein